MGTTGGDSERGGRGPLSALGSTVTLTFSATFVLFCLDRAIQLGILAILARTLTPAEFGIAAGATMLVSIASQLCQFGMGPALIQAARLTDAALAASRALIFAMALGCFAALQILAPYAGEWFRSAEVTDAVRVLAFLCLINAVGLIPHSALIRDLRARDVSLVDVVCGLIGNGLGAVPLALVGWGFWALVWGAVVQTAAKAAAVEVLARIPWTFSFNWAEAQRFWTKGLGFSLTLLLHRVALESDRLIVGRFLNTTALGLYSRANGLMALPSTLFGAVVDRVVFPAFSKVQDDRIRIRRGYGQALSLTALLGGTLSIFLVFQGANVIRFVLGPAWEAAIVPFNILCAAIYFRLSDRVSGTLLRGAGKPYLMASLQTVSALVTIGGCLLAHPYGMSGIAAAVVVGAVISYVLMTTAAVLVAHLNLKDFALSQRHGLAASSLIAAVLYPVGVLSQQWEWSAFLSLAFAGLATGVALLSAAAFFPKVFLGTAGQDLVRTMLGRLLSAA